MIKIRYNGCYSTMRVNWNGRSISKSNETESIDNRADSHLGDLIHI